MPLLSPASSYGDFFSGTTCIVEWNSTAVWDPPEPQSSLLAPQEDVNCSPPRQPALKSSLRCSSPLLPPSLTLRPPVTAPTSDQCCDSFVRSSSEAASKVAAILGLSLAGLNVPVGLDCSPIAVGGNV
ncbi:hypothetical protein C8R44DRAFT_873230 [Mycena epipterygia]|nr:hypothetical protein C8R44DRAFT_873230 [Mycena epipterygia]